MAASAGTASSPRGRVNWRRFAAIAPPSLIAAGVLIVLTSQSVLAVSFSISGTPFTVTAKELRGRGFEQFGVIDHSARSRSNDPRVLAASAIRSAKITDLCQSVSLAGLTMRITAGTGSSPVSATDLVVDADRLSGNASFTKMQIGPDASKLTRVPGVTGPPGTFGQQAATVTITNLRQHAFATTAGTFTLPDFSLHFGGRC
ncbi:MAG: DUF6230 family protein [Nocardiopsaceae bacterium]|jgi:hypothetical protein|nr:DUF6230 family protein [Nocardiopsaceae bacterium]